MIEVAFARFITTCGRRAMTSSRLAPVTGVLFVLLYVVATFVAKTPDTSDPTSAAAAYYHDSGHRNAMVVSAYLYMVAALVFLAFLVIVRQRLLAAEGPGAPLTTLAFASGVIASALIIGGAFALGSVPGGVAFGGFDVPTDGSLVFVSQSIGYGMILIGAMWAAALSIFVASLVGHRTGALPAWAVWLGYIAAIALLFAAIWLPQIALLIWVIAIGIALRKPAPMDAPVPASEPHIA
jgi:hypothetical protein